MKKGYKKAGIACLCAATAVSLMACGGNTAQEAATTVSDSSSGEGEGNISFRFAWWGGDTRHDATLKAIDAFQEKHPNIEIEPEFSSISGYVEKNSLALMNGTAADLIQIGSEFVSEYSGNGKNFYDLYQLKDVIDLSQFPEDVLQQNVVDGKLMALPVSLTGRVFVFNQTTFDEVGVEIPKTLDELYAAGEAFKAYGEDYYPFVLVEYDQQLFVTYYLQSKYNRPWISDGKLNYSVDELAEAMDVLCKMQDSHVIPSIAVLAGDMSDAIDKNPKWINGNYAGTYAWDSSIPPLQQVLAENQDKPGQELVLSDFIQCGEYSGASTKISMNLAIAANTEHPEEVGAFLNYLLNDPEGVQICSTERGVPSSAKALEVLNENNLGDPMVKSANKMVIDAAEFVMDPSYEDPALKAVPDGLYSKVYGKLSSKDYTSQEAAQILYDGINEILAE